LESLLSKWILPYHSKLEEKLPAVDIKILKQIVDLASKLNMGSDSPSSIHREKEVTKISKLLHAVTGESDKSNKKEVDTKKKAKVERSEKSQRSKQQIVSRLEDFENPATYEWLAQFAAKGPEEKRAREYIVLLLAETERLKQELLQISRSRANSSLDTWSDSSVTLSRGETPPLSNSSSSDQVSNRSNTTTLSSSLNSIPPIKKLQISQTVEEYEDDIKEKKQKKEKKTRTRRQLSTEDITRSRGGTIPTSISSSSLAAKSEDRIISQTIKKRAIPLAKSSDNIVNMLKEKSQIPTTPEKLDSERSSSVSFS